MSRQHAILITGANGEIGHALIDHLAEHSGKPIITLDLNSPGPELSAKISQYFTGDIRSPELLERIVATHAVDQIYHLAALLSTRSEFSPALAHKVNVEGTLNLLEFAQHQGQSHGRPVIFFFPSSIAAYGIPNLAIKSAAKPVSEEQFNFPITMYGANKLYCEHLGRYYSHHYKQLSADTLSGKVDFRCLRFPGLISALTLPSGGTSDYVPEMIHAAARKQLYDCFVRPDARIPFMAMPDAVKSIILLTQAPRANLRQSVYNVGAFAPTAAEVEKLVLQAFPDAQIRYEVDVKRQAIVDSWPADVDDSNARKDFGYSPQYNFHSAFTDYLIPQVRKRYQK